MLVLIYNGEERKHGLWIFANLVEVSEAYEEEEDALLPETAQP